MKAVKFIVAASILASVSFVSGQDSTPDTNLKLNVAGVCPTWPICRDVNILEQDNVVFLPNTAVTVASKTV